MTSLRFGLGVLGPGELLVFSWAVWMILSGHYRFRVDVNVRFWVPFLYVLLVGIVIGTGLVPEQARPGQFFSWLYLAFVGVVVYGVLSSRRAEEVNSILTRIGIVAVLWYLPLLAVAEATGSNLGPIRLFYGERFTGGGQNPHQVALLSVVALFINLRSALRARNLRERLLYVTLAVGAVPIGVATMAATWQAAVALTAVMALFIYTPAFRRGGRPRALAVFGALIFLVMAAALWEEKIVEGFWAFMDSDPNGEQRLQIFAAISQTLRLSPVFGLGPGNHAVGDIARVNHPIEYHNTYLEVIAMTGIFGFVLFMGYSIVLLRRLWADPSLYTVVLPLFFYGFSGFAARRLPYWIVLMVASALVHRLSESRDKESIHLPELDDATERAVAEFAELEAADRSSASPMPQEAGSESVTRPSLSSSYQVLASDGEETCTFS